MRPADLIEDCRRLTELELRSPAAASAMEAVEVEMPKRYAMPFPPRLRKTFDRRGSPTANRRGQWHEMVQHLTDLAYLTLQNFEDWHRARREDRIPPPELLDSVLRAIGAFVAEDDYPEFRQLPPFPRGARRERVEWVEKFLPVVVHRLAQYVSFDGELAVREDYRVGEHSCYGRSLAYRVRVYFHDFVDRRTGQRKNYFDATLVKYLHALDGGLSRRFREQLPAEGDDLIHPNLHRLLLEWSFLFDHFTEAHRFAPGDGRDYFLVYDISDTEEERRLEVPDEEKERRRVARLRRRARRAIGRDELHIDTGTNRLGVRLIQLGLWRAGFYTGRLDGAFGAMSHAAVIALIQQERERNEEIERERELPREERSGRDIVLKDRRLAKLLVNAGEAGGDALWVVNLRYMARLLEAYAPAATDEEARREETQLWEGIRRSGKEDELDRTFTERQREVRNHYGDLAGHRDRRVYYGLRGLIRGAFRALGRVVNWIKQRVSEILGAVFDFVKATVKRIQEGLGMFFEGFRYFAHYLLGKPFISLAGERDGQRGVIYTRFQVDFDTVSIAHAGATEEDLRNHNRYLTGVGEGIEYFLSTTIRLIRLIGRLRPPMGWLWLGISIARGVRALLRTAVRAAIA